ncbi:hypothetical protein [Qipengyuania sp. NPDC077563]|uniref:hypothetical protein n=1 Tax=Qipengyuania sp. NPDC077563 TaxID=3364497 RepID=UPI0038505923
MKKSFFFIAAGFAFALSAPSSATNAEYAQCQASAREYAKLFGPLGSVAYSDAFGLFVERYCEGIPHGGNGAGGGGAGGGGIDFPDICNLHPTACVPSSD